MSKVTVARSLWLAGCALSDQQLRQVAVEAIEGVFRSLISEHSIPSAHLCHGVAGLLQICLRFAHECDSMLVQEQIPLLVEQILDAFHPEFVVGFRNVDRDQQIDDPTWLNGAVGIAMTLLAASTPAPPNWDRALAIA